MKLTLFFCRVPLGVLEKGESGYAYTSYTANEQMLLIQGALFYSEYGLWDSYRRESKTLFRDMERFLAECSRRDIQERAGISPEDSRWEKLVKLAQLKWFPSGFYLQLTGNVEEECNYHLTSRKNEDGGSQKDGKGWED